MKAVDETSQLTGEKDGGNLTDKSGEVPCAGWCVDGVRAGSLPQLCRSSAELPGQSGCAMVGANHTTLRSWISPTRVAKGAPVPGACCFVKHKVLAGVSSVQSCSQVKVVFSLCMATSLFWSVIWRFCGPVRSAFFSLAPLCCVQALQCLFQGVTSGVLVSLYICLGFLWVVVQKCHLCCWNHGTGCIAGLATLKQELHPRGSVHGWGGHTVWV